MTKYPAPCGYQHWKVVCAAPKTPFCLLQFARPSWGSSHFSRIFSKNEFVLSLRMNCTPNRFFSMFCSLFQTYQYSLINNMVILKQIVWETHKSINIWVCHAAADLLIKTCKILSCSNFTAEFLRQFASRCSCHFPLLFQDKWTKHLLYYRHVY